MILKFILVAAEAIRMRKEFYFINRKCGVSEWFDIGA